MHDTAKVSASFYDYQKGRIWRDGGVVSKWYKGANNSGTKRHEDDRFYMVVAKAEVSKRIREVILRSVNAGLKAWFENECRKVMELTLDDDKVAEIVASFRGIGVGLEDLEKLVGKPKAMGWMPGDRQRLLGVWNAIKAGETTKDIAFGSNKPVNDHAEQAAEARKKKTEAKPAEPTFDRDKRMAAFRRQINEAKGDPDKMDDVRGAIEIDPNLDQKDRDTLYDEAEAATKQPTN